VLDRNPIGIEERWNDRRRNMVQDASKDTDNRVREPRRYTFAERYDEGKLAVHLHLGIRVGGVESESGDFCTVFKRGVKDVHAHIGLELPQWDHDKVTVLVSLADTDVDGVLNGSHGVQDLMPVNAGEFVEVPKPMVPGVYPGLERLQALDACPVFSGEIGDLVLCALSSEGVAGIADRERRLAGGRLRSLAGPNCGCQTRWSRADRMFCKQSPTMTPKSAGIRSATWTL
jgi:hypothetical protein